ncbi:hypothetical protein FHR81_001415 [Actinoalloteichus hoggarensis]|uniref:Uncharacterized protein n=1 Tax=Actinoalloteichus hoggarensis TaxID=1470176 RepID=A0A221W069_9PSEU|nr:hypothetical protein [Actinoalloteichus hoggarensis]ASO19149.1 hypothetical protein AHOG_07510 [Actinoalloteichus hoggarensis]MBB5920385.1 hypothetical protein [Actinoalloteichus hoggarensis]
MSAEQHAGSTTPTHSPAADDLAGSLAARRSLGADAEDAVIASFLERTGESIDRRVEERVAAELAARNDKTVIERSDRRRKDSQSLALAITSLALAVPITILAPVGAGTLVVVWLAIVAVNIAFRTM